MESMVVLKLLIWLFLAYKSAAQTGPPLFNFEAEIEEPKYALSDEDDNVKELFFRRVRGYEGEVPNAESTWNYFVDIPQPGGFENSQEKNKRSRRETNSENESIDKSVGKSTVKPSSDGHVNIDELKKFNAETDKEDGVVGISDFIRFRRDLKIKPVEKELEDMNTSFSKNQERTGKMLLQDSNIVPENSREPRGATKEQWIKQPYPVHAVSIDDNNYEDNMPSPSDVRAPRVHFVTQRRLETAPPNNGNYGSIEREGRARDFSKDVPRESPRGTAPRSPPPRKPERDLYPERPYPTRFFNPYRDDPYYRYEESRYEPAEYDHYRPEYSSTSRQRRIIYYATLPEVVRTPPNVNLRDRYSYRDRYDDRYVSSPSLSVAENDYRFRKPYPFGKSRYEHEMERTKSPYPLKVSTDVNVRETKKNPERRIYSEPDRRYAYKAPAYQSEESFERRI